MEGGQDTGELEGSDGKSDGKVTESQGTDGKGGKRKHSSGEAAETNRKESKKEQRIGASIPMNSAEYLLLLL